MGLDEGLVGTKMEKMPSELSNFLAGMDRQNSKLYDLVVLATQIADRLDLEISEPEAKASDKAPDPFNEGYFSDLARELRVYTIGVDDLHKALNKISRFI